MASGSPAMAAGIGGGGGCPPVGKVINGCRDPAGWCGRSGEMSVAPDACRTTPPAGVAAAACAISRSGTVSHVSGARGICAPRPITEISQPADRRTCATVRPSRPGPTMTAVHSMRTGIVQPCNCVLGSWDIGACRDGRQPPNFAGMPWR